MRYHRLRVLCSERASERKNTTTSIEYKRILNIFLRLINWSKVCVLFGVCSLSLRPSTRYISWMLKWYSLFTIGYERTTYTIQCICVQNDEQMKGKYTLSSAELQSLYFTKSNMSIWIQINSNNRSVYLFSFFHVVLFSFSFSSLCLARSLRLVRCHCFRSFSLLQFNFKAKTRYHRTFICTTLIYAILHVQCTLYDPSSAIDWQNDQFLMCTSLSAINAIVVAVVVFSVRHSFVRTIIWLNRIEQTENLLKEFMILRLITDWALFWVNDFYSHVIHILW